jgi:AraC-like DNA-binding protein
MCSQTKINKHNMPYNEITIVLKGELNYLINGESVTVSPCDVIFVKRGSDRQREAVNQAEYISFNFISDIDYNLPLLLKGGVNDVLHQIISTFISIYKLTSNLKDERFSLLLSLLIKQLEVQRILQTEPPLVNEIKNYIRLNLDKKITLLDISNHTHYSVSHCEMLFHKTTNLSITAYLIKKRIEKSKLLLIERSLPLPEVAEAVGFSDYNYFSRTFKKETGISPLSYRNSYYL